MSSTPTESGPSSSTLPDLSEVPEDQRDRVWFEKYYQGDNQKQLTPRAVLMGGILGAAMSISNLYTTLKIGWAFGVAITACVLSYAIWNVFVAVGLAKTKMSMLENNCMQSTASSAGFSTGGTLATAVGAMLLVTGAHLHWLTVTVWVFLTALLGVFLAIPMKRQMINRDQLPFPSGIAAAETLRSLYAEGRESLLKARALIASLGVGIAVGVARSLGWIVESIPLNFRMFAVKGRTVMGAQLAGFSFEPSVLLIAAGMIVGIRVSTWMFIGSLINYTVLTPYAMGLVDWVDGTKTFIGHMEVAMADGELAVVKVTRWSLWLGTALLVASGLTSFALGWKTIARSIRSAMNKKTGEDADVLASIEVPMSWLVWGGVPVTIGLCLLCWIALGISPWLGLVSVLLSFVLALVACRATGETDTTPIGAMGKITQFTYAVLDPGNTTTNLMTAGITAGAAGSAADLLTDLKSGYLLGANPRQQFLAQLAGVFFGMLAVIPAWYLLIPNREALETFAGGSPPLATGMWYAVAQALSQGVHVIPESARWAIAVGGILGVALSLSEGLAPKNIRTWVPSSMGLGLAFVVPMQNSLSFFIGAVIALLWTKGHKKSAEQFIIPIASGAVAGESLSAAGYAMFEAMRGLFS